MLPAKRHRMPYFWDISEMEDIRGVCGYVWICRWLCFSSWVCGMGQLCNRMKKLNIRVSTSPFSRHMSPSAKLDHPPNYVTHQILFILPFESPINLFLRRRLSPQSNTIRESRWIVSHNFVDGKIFLFISRSEDKYEDAGCDRVVGLLKWSELSIGSRLWRRVWDAEEDAGRWWW